MGYTPLFVGPLNEGIRRDLQPFLLPNEAYPDLENAYEFRGSIYKKGGNKLIGRLGTRSETLVAARGAGATVVNLALRWPPVEVGSIIITDGVTTFTDDGVGFFTIDPPANGHVIGPTVYAAGTVNISFDAANPGAAIIATYFTAIGPYSPVMGLRTLELQNTVDTVLMAFDTRMSYRYDNTTQGFQHIVNYRTVANPVEWTGTDKDFFWSTNYQDGFFASNNIPGANFYAITNITNAAAAIITIGAHNLLPTALPFPGDKVLITNVIGMDALGGINGLVGTVTAIGATTITVNINSAGMGAYVSGGVAHSIYKTKVVAGVNAGDGIRWYDNGVAKGWVNFTPPLISSNTAAGTGGVPPILQGTLMMFTYQGRLVCLNTVEGSTKANAVRYAQRARWSIRDSIFQGNIAPTGNVLTQQTNQWVGIGSGSIDAPTGEDIISAALIKDTLMVFFEHSTWALYYTANDLLPFVWQRINIERGSQSTFSTIGFDSEVFTIDKEAVIACEPTGLLRRDLKIPDEVASFDSTHEAFKRIYGIRDFFDEFVYWTFVSENHLHIAQQTTVFPDTLLVYNYRDDTWALFDEQYTCFGKYITINSVTWGSLNISWQAANYPWEAPALQDGFPIIVGGNSQGFVHHVSCTARDADYTSNDVMYNIQDISGAIPSVITCLNNSFSDSDKVYITDVQGPLGAIINGNIYGIVNTTGNTFELEDVVGFLQDFPGYTYGGKITKVDDFLIKTKRFNPMLSEGKKTRVGYIDLFMENNSVDEGVLPTDPNARINFYLRIDETNGPPAIDIEIPTHDFKNIGNEKFWYRVYVNQVGQAFQMELSYNIGQIFNTDLMNQPFVLYSFIVWTTDAGRLV